MILPTCVRQALRSAVLRPLALDLRSNQVDTNPTETTSIRPYFLASSVDFEQLPESVKAVFDSIIEPLYRELVIEAPNALERAGGATFVFWLTEETLRQIAVGGSMDVLQTQSDAQSEAREKAVVRCLRVSSAKDKALAALARLRKFADSRRRESLSFSTAPPAFSTE